MIAHIAEKGEERGRVLLQLGPSGSLSEITVQAALSLAHAFQSEVESLFVEDAGLIDVAAFPFAREISLSGRRNRPLTLGDVERELQATAAALHRRIVGLAQRAAVPCRCRTMRDSIEAAVARACAENGPWNVVAVAEPVRIASASAITRLMEVVEGMTGVLVAGPNARRTSGTVVALIESLEHVPAMLRTAERISAVTDGKTCLLISAAEAEEASWIEGQARLVMAGATAQGCKLETVLAGPEAVVSALHRLDAGLVIVRLGGRTVSDARDLATLASRHEGPLLLVR